MSKRLIYFVLGIIFGAMCSYHFITKPTNKTYVYVDVDKIISHIVKDISQSKVEDVTSRIDNLKQSFERALTDYEKAHNAIIFSSPKPIKGAVDKTDFFIERIKNEDKSNQEKSQ